MLNLTKDIQPLTTFRRKSAALLSQIKKSKRPVVLTVNGKAAAVLQDAEAYQRLLDMPRVPTSSKRSAKGLTMQRAVVHVLSERFLPSCAKEPNDHCAIKRTR